MPTGLSLLSNLPTMKRSIALLSLVTLLAAACAKSEEEQSVFHREICFSTSMDGFAVKATDTSFEEGDAIGISIGAPVSRSNCKLTMTGSQWTSAQPVCWADGQDGSQSSSFYAYYPYAECRDLAQGFSFTVQADQSAHEGYTASDLMTAVTSASPEDGVVELPFRHRLSKVLLRIDNDLSIDIADVYLADVYGKAYLQNDDELQIEGGTGTIKTGAVTLVDGSSAWALVLVPQTFTPKLLITTSDQRQFTYTIEEPINLQAGHSYLASLTLTSGSVATDFSVEVSKWTDNADIQFSDGNLATVLSGVDGNVYKASGWVDEVYDQNYGNFYIKDTFGNRLRIYGTITPAGLYPKDTQYMWLASYFSLVPGDHVTVIGTKGSHYGTTELVDVFIAETCRQSIGRLGGVVSLPSTQGEYTLVARIENPENLQIRTEDFWIDVSQTKLTRHPGGSWYAFPFIYAANMVDGEPNHEKREGQILLSDGITECVVPVSQLPCPYDMGSTILSVLEAEDNTLLSFNGIVHAISTRGYVVYDGNHAILVYTGSIPDCQVGDKVQVEGTRTTYIGMPEITNPSYQVISSGEPLFEMEYQNITEGYDEFVSSVSVPISLEGTLASNTRLLVEGAAKACQIYWPTSDLGLLDLVGLNVRIRGFYFGSYIIATSATAI